jgi:glycosyltransferase involved in cell wall biosynthesis
MRIGMLLDAVFPPDPRVENEALTLIKAGHKVFLFCLNYGGQVGEETIKGISVKRYLSSKLEYKLSALAYTVPFYKKSISKKIKHFLETNHIETIHVHDIQVAGAAFKANYNLKLPVVLDLHENRPEIMKFYPHLHKFPGKYIIKPTVWKFYEKLYVEKATATIVVTEEAKEDLLQRCSVPNDQIVVVPNTVHQSFYKDAIVDKAIVNKYQDYFVLLYLGDTGLRRGLITAIESVSKLAKEIKNIKLVIVGTSSAGSLLQEKVEELQIENYVDFEGWQNVSLFPSYIKASSICISPLHKNKHHDTTYANKIFQYMSLGKPLLISDVTAQKSIVKRANCGLTHRAEDRVDFTKQVLEMYANTSLTDEYGVNGKIFIENEFTWEQTSKNLLHLYDNLSL